MLRDVLEIAAYCSLGVATGLLLMRLFWPKLGPRLEVRRFRRRLGKAEDVLASWVKEGKALEEERRRRHEQRHPETTDD